MSCYEAGRDGFWIHRALDGGAAFANRVVDSASIEVNRRARRAKTDRIDALKLVLMLVRVCCGEQQVWREVRVPTVAEEAARQVSRERTELTQERTRLLNQMRSWLVTWGCALPARRGQRGGGRRCAIGPARRCRREVQARLARAEPAAAVLEEQIAELDGQQRASRRRRRRRVRVGRLVRIKGVATTSAVGAARRRAGVADVSQSAARWVACSALPRRPIKAASAATSKGSVARGNPACKRSAFSWRGIGCAGNR